MPQFKFNTISRTDIERSHGGNMMISAIDYDGDDHQVITGVPGSGKTTVTIMRAERLVNQGKKIRLFTFQSLLTINLRNFTSDIVAENIHSFYRWYFDQYGFLHQTHSEEDMKTKMVEMEKVDEILIDEGQDFEERIYRALLVKSKKITVGADNAQKVHERGIYSQQIEKELGSSVHIRLEYNYRNTYEIYNFSRQFMPHNERVNNLLPLQKMPRGLGNLPIVFRVLNQAENIQRIKTLLEDAGERNIAILVYRQADVENYYSILTRMGFGCTKHHSRSRANHDIENILITTYKSAKGLEFQVVIMPEMHNAMIDPEQTPEHYYIGCTRAKENLYLTYEGENLPGCISSFESESYTRVDLSTITKEKDDVVF